MGGWRRYRVGSGSGHGTAPGTNPCALAPVMIRTRTGPAGGGPIARGLGGFGGDPAIDAPRWVPPRRAGASALGGALAATVLLATTTQGADLEDLFIGGFVSQGYINTSENNYLVPRAREGSGEFNEAAIAVSVLPADRTRIGIQFLARDLGDEGNNQVLVDWAYGDYRWRDTLGFRGGKIKLPYGLYSTVRDVDVARTFVLLPQGVYDERLRDFFSAYEGASLYGNSRCDPLGQLEYEIYVGALNVPDPTRGFWNDIFQRIGTTVVDDPDFVAEIADSFEVTVDRITFGGILEPEASLPWLVGGAAIWNTPVEGLRVGGSWLRSRYEASARVLFNIDARDPVTDRPEHFRIDLRSRTADDVEFITSLSAEYSRDSYTAAFEYTQQNTGGGDSIGLEPVSEGYYLALSYRLHSAVTLGSYYSRYFTDKHDREGDTNVLHGFPDFSAWQHDLGVGVRIDLSDHWLVKIEEHWVDGVGQLTPTLNSGPDGSLEVQRLWSYFTAKTTFHF